MDMRASLVDIDWQAFEPWRIQAVGHRLMRHPLLDAEPLIELGRRLEGRRCVRTHGNEAAAGTPFNGAPDLHPNPRSAVETMQQIAGARAWMSLLNVQSDRTYRTLVDEVLDELKPGIDRVDPGMCYRGGWIFITSPHTVTPFHFDKEHNERLRALGLRPPGVGKGRSLDACLHAGFGAVASIRERARRLAGRLPRSDRVPYACVGRH